MDLGFEKIFSLKRFIKYKRLLKIKIKLISFDDVIKNVE